MLTEIESKRILHALDLPVTVPEVAASADAAATAAAKIGFPVVLKVLSPDVSHKSDVGGVELNLGTEDEVRDAFERIRRNLATKAPGAGFDGVAVQPMARAGIELIVGTMRDARFGAMVMVGLGGVLVEVMKDTAIRLAPIGGREAANMLRDLRGAQILRGVRGQPGADIDAIVALLETVAGLAAAHPEIAEMDLNPVVAYNDGVAILDARIVLAPARRRDSSARSASRRASRKPQTRIQPAHRRRHRRQAHGRIHVAARDGASEGQALLGSDRSERDPRHREDSASRIARASPRSPSRSTTPSAPCRARSRRAF